MKKIISVILTFVLILNLANIPFANVYRSGDEEKIETKFYSVIEQAKTGNYEVLLDNIDLRFYTFVDSVDLIKDYIGDIEIIDDIMSSGEFLSKIKKSFAGNIAKDLYSETTKRTFKPFDFILKKVDKINDYEYAVLLEINMPEKKYYEDIEIEYEKMKKKSGLALLDLMKIGYAFTGLGFIGDKIDSSEYLLKSSLVDYENYNIQTVTRTIKICKLDNNYKMVLNLNEYLDDSISDIFRTNKYDATMFYSIIGKIKYNGNDENDLALVNYLLKPMINMLKEQVEVK